MKPAASAQEVQPTTPPAIVVDAASRELGRDELGQSRFKRGAKRQVRHFFVQRLRATVFVLS
jgi:hypothetical protein